MKAFFGFVSDAEINRVRTDLELSVTVIQHAAHCNTFTFFGHYGSQEKNAMAESQVHKTMYHVMQIFFFRRCQAEIAIKMSNFEKKNECKIQVKMKWKLR